MEDVADTESRSGSAAAVERNAWHAEPGTTPVTDVPEDYYPRGCGGWFEVPDGPNAGKRLFVRDSIHGDGAPEETVVFVHGNPECSYTWRHVVSHLERLADNPFRVVAIARWVDVLPQLEGHVTAFENVSHFVEEERPSSVGAAIRDVAAL